MKTKSMDVLEAKLARHPRREIKGRSWDGTPCIELMALDGERPVVLLPNGYARVNDGQGGMVLAHRAALAVATGRDVWTEPLVTDHLCHTRSCVNPAHLEWVTHAVNVSAERTSPEGTKARRVNGRAAGRIYGRIYGRANGRAHADATRIAVVSRHLDTGECRYHRDQTAAARELGVHQGNIAHVLRGKYYRTGRYAFVRYDPEDPVHVILRAAALALDAEGRGL